MEKTMKTIVAFLMSLLLVSAANAQQVGPNGGMLAGKGDHQMELVVAATELTIYVIDHGKPHGTNGVNLRAIVQQGGKSTNVALVDVDNKKLVGKLDEPLGAGAIVVVSGKDDHGAVLTARFTIK
jgi:hypothetical protein